jgi:transcriptional regulator with XRE-family HTH domain
MFGDRLSELRKRKNVSRRELADILGVDKETIKSWELGRRTPKDIDLLVKLADFFDCDLDYLVGRDRKKEVGDLGRLMEILKELPEEKREITINFLKTII